MQPDQLNPDSGKEWLTPAEAGAILGVGPDRVAQLVRQGVLPAMRTPGGHVRTRRDKVEELANPAEQPPPTDEPEEPGQDQDEDDLEDTDGAPARPKWHNVPPWKQKVREAEADLKALEFDDQREQLLEARTERQRKRKRADTQQLAAAAEVERLRKLKSRALSLVPWSVPNDERAKVARQLERAVTTNRYPASLAQEHVDTLVRSDVEQLLHQWREQEAAKARELEEGRARKNLIDRAVTHANLRAPGEWDWDASQDFERAVRRALKDELGPGMDQDDADDIAFRVLDEWLTDEDAEEGEGNEDEYDDDDEYEDEDDD